MLNDLTNCHNSRPTRVVLLGASNLTLGFPIIAQSLRESFGRLQLYAAHGHGRSFGMTSRVLYRTLPGIRSSQIWHDLQNSQIPTSHTYALITDVGNDVLYGASIDAIVGWVQTCLTRLNDCGAQTVVATLPMGSVLRLGRTRYSITKACFFPGKGPSYHEVRLLAGELNERLISLARASGAAVVTPADDWYGFDPIHIRRSRRLEAWTQILAPWECAIRCRPAVWRDSVRLWRLRPAERRLFGKRQTQPQPVLGGNSDFSLWLY